MLPTLTDAVQSAGWAWQGIVVWDKTPACRPQLGRFRSQAEFIVWASCGLMNPKAHPVTPVGVFATGTAPREKRHQVGKPLALMEHLVKIVPLPLRSLIHLQAAAQPALPPCVLDISLLGWSYHRGTAM